MVRCLAPKTQHKPIAFRDAQGDPLNTQQEAQALREYFESLYKSDSPEPQPPGNFHVPFTLPVMNWPQFSWERPSLPGLLPRPFGPLQLAVWLRLFIPLLPPG